MKLGKVLTTVPVFAWWVYDRIEKTFDKKKAKGNANTLDNLEKLYNLKKTGAITEEDYNELKEKLKERV